MFPNWFYYALLNGTLIGSERPENLHAEASGKLDVTRRLAQRLVAEHGVRTVVNLTERAWTYGTEELAVHHLPMSDRYIDQTAHETLERAVGIIGQGISAGRGVWVHCQGGIDRTGCVVGCYLVSTGTDTETAIGAIKDRWPERRKKNPTSHELWEPVAERIRAYSATRRR